MVLNLCSLSLILNLFFGILHSCIHHYPHSPSYANSLNKRRLWHKKQIQSLHYTVFTWYQHMVIISLSWYTMYGATWHWHKVKGYWKILLGSSWLLLVLNLAMIWMIRILVAQKVNHPIIMELISLIHCTYQLARKLSSAWIALSSLWKPGSSGLFLKSPGNFSGPKSSIQIKIWRKGVRVLASKLVHFVSLTNSFIRCKTIENSILHVNMQQQLYGPINYLDVQETSPRP